MRTSRARSIAPHAVMFIILMNIGAVAAFRWPSASDRRAAGLQSQNALGAPDAALRAAGCEPNTALPVVRHEPPRTRGETAKSCLEVERGR